MTASNSASSAPYRLRYMNCIGDGRQSGTSASPSILDASPEAALGGGLALLRNGDRTATADS